MKSVITIFLCIVSISLTAQDRPPTKKAHWEKMKNYKPIMVKTAGVSFQEFENLNSRIGGFSQYKQMKKHMYTLSLGSMHVIKNFIHTASISVGSSLSGDPDEKSSAVRFLAGGLDFGYDVIPAARVMLYPTVGIGAEKYHAVFYKDVNAVTFNNVANSSAAQNDIRSVKFVNNFMTYRLGLGLGFKSPDGGHSIGLQGMYIGSFKDDKAWRSGESQLLSGAPVDDLERIAVSLVITGSMMGKGK